MIGFGIGFGKGFGFGLNNQGLVIPGQRSLMKGKQPPGKQPPREAMQKVISPFSRGRYSIKQRKSSFLQLSLGEDLVFEPVRKGHGGTYYCLAKNDIGSSDELSTTFEVLFPPINVQTQPNRVANLTVGDRKHFECFAEGYPKPKFEWLQTNHFHQ